MIGSLLTSLDRAETEVGQGWSAQVPNVAQKACARFVEASCAPAADEHSRRHVRTSVTAKAPAGSAPSAPWKRSVVKRSSTGLIPVIQDARNRPCASNP